MVGENCQNDDSSPHRTRFRYGGDAEATQPTQRRHLSESLGDMISVHSAWVCDPAGGQPGHAASEPFASSPPRKVVDLRRTLAMRNPDAFQPDLAGSLNNLGTRLSELGQREPALV